MKKRRLHKSECLNRRPNGKGQLEPRYQRFPLSATRVASMRRDTSLPSSHTRTITPTSMSTLAEIDCLEQRLIECAVSLRKIRARIRDVEGRGTHVKLFFGRNFANG